MLYDDNVPIFSCPGAHRKGMQIYNATPLPNIAPDLLNGIQGTRAMLG
jgi:hypothetical protein